MTPLRKIKILQVVQAFATGGAEIYLYHLCELLNRDKFEVYIVNFLEGDQLNDRFSQLKNVHITSFDYSSRYDFRILFSLMKAIHCIKPDIIHTQLPIANIYSRIACLFSKQIIVSTQHSTEYIRNFFHAVDRITALRNTMYIANSEYTARFLMKYHYCNTDKIRTIPLSIQAPDTTRNLPSETLKQLNIPQNAAVIGMIGSFKTQKGHVYLIHAMSEVVKLFPNCILLLLGEGELMQSIKNLVSSLGLVNNVRFLGLQSDIYPYIQLMKICVFPSLTESFGLAILDAMSQKVPVIASNVDAIPELVEHNRTGLLVPIADKTQLAQAIIYLLNNETIRHNLAENAFQTHKKSFSFSDMVQKTEKLYLELSPAKD